MSEHKKRTHIFRAIALPVKEGTVRAFQDMARNPDVALRMLNRVAPDTGALVIQDFMKAGRMEIAASCLVAGAGKQVLRIIEKLERSEQVEILSQPEMVWALTRRGQTKGLLSLLSTFDNAELTSVLAAPQAVWGLVNNGNSKAVIELIRRLDPEQRATVMTAKDAVAGLVLRGQLVETMALAESLSEAAREKIVANPYTASVLRRYKQYDGIKGPSAL